MAKHMDTIEEACSNLWKMLDTLNNSFKGEAKDGEQLHDVIASLYKLNGLKMLEESQDRDGQSWRNGSYSNGNYSTPGGHSGVWYDPMMHGVSYNWDAHVYDGVSGITAQPRDSQGQFRLNRNRKRGSSYHNGLVSQLEMEMEEASPEMRRAYMEVIRDLCEN